MAQILFLLAESTSSGIHDYAYYRMLEEGHEVVVAAAVKKPTRTVVIFAGGADGAVDTFEQRPGWIIDVDVAFDDVDPATFDALVIPGGPGPEYLRANRRCVEIVRHFIENDKPVTGICHGPNVILEALIRRVSRAGVSVPMSFSKLMCGKRNASGFMSPAKP